ncbi:unnamed protein product, partial [Chrysoparadoxa australica]
LDTANSESDPEVTAPIFIEDLGMTKYVWLKRGGFKDIIVKAHCQLLPNGVTVMVRLTDATERPPLRIENRSSTHMLAYRMGENGQIVTLDPMRWNAYLWEDNSRGIDVGFMGEGVSARLLGQLYLQGSSSGSGLGSNKRDLFSGLDKALTGKFNRRGSDGSSLVARSTGFNPTRYEPKEFGALPDLVQGNKRLKVECFRRSDAVSTMVIAFSDADFKLREVYGMKSRQGMIRDLGTKADEVYASLQSENGGIELGLELWISGVMVNITDSTIKGPIEVCSIVADHIMLKTLPHSGKVQFSVWHFQIDDMLIGSSNPVILQQPGTGFNSHLGTNPRPLICMEYEKDRLASASHLIQAFAEVYITVADLSCSIHADYWVDIATLVSDALDWSSGTSASQRCEDVALVQDMLGGLINVPCQVDQGQELFLHRFEQAPFSLSISFKMGRKLLAYIGATDEAYDESEEQITMIPMMGALSSMVDTILSVTTNIVNASQVFVFQKTEASNYFGSNSDFLSFLGRRFTSQAVNQAFKVVGHIDIIGDPLSLAAAYSSGVVNFVSKTSKGRAKEGAKDLVKGVVGGTASSASKIASAVENLVTGWEEEDPDQDEVLRRLHLKQRNSPGAGSEEPVNKHLGHGLMFGAQHFGRGVVKGVAGLVYEPYKGVKKEGGKGFAKGVGKGVVGLVAQPVGGVLGAASHITKGIEATTTLFDGGSLGR